MIRQFSPATPYSSQFDDSLSLSNQALIEEPSKQSVIQFDNFSLLEFEENDERMADFHDNEITVQFEELEPQPTHYDNSWLTQFLNDENQPTVQFEEFDPQITQVILEAGDDPFQVFLRNEEPSSSLSKKTKGNQRASSRVKKVLTREEIFEYLQGLLYLSSHFIFSFSLFSFLSSQIDPLPPGFQTREEYLLKKIPLQSEILECPYLGCRYQPKCRSETIQHILGIHQKPLDHICRLCNRPYNAAKYLKEHFRNFHSNRLISDSFAP